MASCSRPRRRVLNQSDIFTTLESENDDSSGDEDTFLSDVNEENEDEGDSEYEEVAEPQTKKPRGTSRPRSSNFVWCRGEFSPTLFPFTAAIQGIKPNVPIDSDSSELEAFLLIFDDNFVAHVVQETNNFFAFVATTCEIKDKSRIHKWVDTSIEEMYLFFSALILMGQVKKLRIADYWSTDTVIATPFFGKIMGVDRFLIILRMLHFSPNREQIPGDRLHKIRRICEMLKESFAAIFSPYQDVCIDESLMLWKGRLSFRQYIPSKRHRFGIKLYVLCDCLTGYILDFLVYTGKTTDLLDVEKDLGISGAIVVTLMEPFLGKGHKLFTDNWYTSPNLGKALHEQQTGLCGTVKPNRQGFPKDFPANMRKGDCEEKHTEDMLAVKWHDKRSVHMLTTVNETGQSSSGKRDRMTNEPIMKPNCVLEYNKKMGLIDKSDMQISFSETQRKSQKWYKKLFFHMMDLALYNAYIIYKHASKKSPQLSEFKLEVSKQLFERFQQPRKNPKGGRPSSSEDPSRLTDRHFPDVVPPTESKQNPTRRCYVCANTTTRVKQRKETRYMCKECDLALCVHPCFKEYHTKKKFRILISTNV